jgi:16S rRNA (guanine527-N7)-methyltransferase
MNPAAVLQAGLDELGLPLAAEARRRLLSFGRLLQKWNRTYQLTAQADDRAIVALHLLDSLAILPWLDEGPLADIGSGGGTPGIPLAIARPGLAVRLVESNGKKAAFLRQASIELPLPNAEVVEARVEAWQPQERPRMVTSRAFASLADFVALTRHLPAPGGRWLAMKGQYPADEIAALPPGVVVEAVHPLRVPGIDAARHLVVLRES